MILFVLCFLLLLLLLPFSLGCCSAAAGSLPPPLKITKLETIEIDIAVLSWICWLDYYFWLRTASISSSPCQRRTRLHRFVSVSSQQHPVQINLLVFLLWFLRLPPISLKNKLHMCTCAACIISRVGYKKKIGLWRPVWRHRVSTNWVNCLIFKFSALLFYDACIDRTVGLE